MLRGIVLRRGAVTGWGAMLPGALPVALGRSVGLVATVSSRGPRSVRLCAIPGPARWKLAGTWVRGCKRVEGS